MSEETITVILKNTWFAPTTTHKKSPLQSMSGRRFKKGQYTWPARVRPYLPKSATVLEDDVPEVEDPLDGAGFDGYHGDEEFGEDIGRSAATELARIEAEADKNDKVTKSPEEIFAERQANLRKANEARKAKRLAKEEAKAREAAETSAPDADANEAPAVDDGPSEILIEEDGDTVEF